MSRGLGMARLRIFCGHFALLSMMAFGLPWLYRGLLHLPPEQADETRRAFLAGVLVLTLAQLLTQWLGLRGVDVTPPDPHARRRVLGLPIRLALVTLVGGELLTAGAMLYDQWRGRSPLSLAAGLTLCTGAMIALAVVPIFAFSRAALLPWAQRHATEELPDGPPLSLRVQFGYTVFAIATATLVPATVFGMAQLRSAALANARARAENTAARLAATAAPLDVRGATQVLTETPLSEDEQAILRAPSGWLIPEDAADEVSWMPFVERPLKGELAGGSLRVYYAPRPISPVPLLAITLALLLLAVVVAAALGDAVARDAGGVAIQIARMAEGNEPQPLGVVTTHEVRRVTMAVNRLLDRIPRLTVETYLAIEFAEEAQRLKAQFLANMSHDLRSPLNSILGFSELLLRGIEGPISPDQREVLTTVHTTGLMLLRLLTEILDTAKVESGKMELHRQATPPSEILTQAAQEARRGRSAAAIEQLTVSLQPGMVPIYVDPLRLPQAVTHLLNYGLDAAGGGRVSLRIREGEVSESRVLVLDLEHAGPLDDAERAQVFDGFRRLRRNQGLNLALPLAKRIIELHGGTLELLAPSAAGLARFRGIVPVGVLREKATPTRGVPRIR